MRTNIKQDKGIAGLTILLSLVTFLFVIGLLVMIFSMMGGELIKSSYTSTSASVNTEAVTSTDLINASKGYTLALSLTAQDFASPSIDALYNNTNELLTTGNYTLIGNAIFNATALDGLKDVKVDYSYTYGATNDATDVMNDTTSGIGSVTDWFSIFVVIGAMIVLILLTVIIISAIRGSGLMAGGSA